MEPGETVIAAAARELEEEAGIRPLDLTHVGELTFNFDDNPQPWLVHVYRVRAFEGEIVESDEMAPEWFSVDHLPFDRMWADDVHWCVTVEGREGSLIIRGSSDHTHTFHSHGRIILTLDPTTIYTPL